MPRIESSIVINGPIERVYECAKDVETFPDYMPDVKEVKIVERDGSRVVSAWTAYIPDFKMTVKWVEEDLWDDAAFTCNFKLVKGDYTSYSGLWKFTPIDGGCQFDSVVEYEYDIPLIGPLIQGLVKKKVQENVDQIQQSIKTKVESM